MLSWRSSPWLACDSSDVEPGQLTDAGLEPIQRWEGAGAFRWEASVGPGPIDVFYYAPPARAPTARIVIALHGNDRDARGMRDNWVGKADAYGLVVVAPAFDSATPLGAPGTSWVTSSRTETTYTLFGHSGGGQFAHRFVMFFPEARFDRVLAANAGWYTVPDPAIGFPYGIDGGPVAEDPVQYFSRELVLLLGDQDTDPNSPGLRHNAQADAQGLHRFARGQHFAEQSRSIAELGGDGFAWTVEIVPGVGHDGRQMSLRAADCAFGP